MTSINKRVAAQAQVEPKGAAVRFPPPAVPVLVIATGMLVHWFFPVSTVIAMGVARFVLGTALFAAGLALMGFAIGWFRKTGQDPAPWKSSPELIVEGVYRWTRNPMYVGMGLFQAGVGLLLGSAWPLLLVPMTWWLIFLTAIRHEEAYLSKEFGDAYERYRAATRRWL